MSGGSGKLGRLRSKGGGASKRSIHAPPINHAGRTFMGGGLRGHGGAPSAAVSSPCTSSMQVDGVFSLVRENPLNFGMAVKLAPGLVEEIKRVEAQGIEARMKFDGNDNNPNGNLIHVGDKIFRFTWWREPGDLCDIYEERQSGEDGNGLLVESGSTWRKLNVERELDESAKNQVKMRSEEAERKHRSRKSIVLDHQNPSMKSQVKAIAAAESIPRRNFKNRKEPPFKKAKVEASGGPPKSVLKSGLSTTTLSKDVAPTQSTNNIIRDKFKHNRHTDAKPADLKNLVISQLQEHRHSGISRKALERAIGVMPNSARQLDPILKQIAIYKAPGRYYLKEGTEKESFKNTPSRSGRSPEINRHQSPSPQKPNQLPAQDPSSTMTTPVNGVEEHGELNSTPLHTADITEKIDILQNSPQRLHDKKVSDNSKELTGSSSDSDSDSSDNDSESHSRSPVGSSSDSESDASFSSKQASDEDVDIMSDDDEESKHKLPDNESVDIVTYEKKDDLHLTDAIDIEKDERPSANDLRPNNKAAEMSSKSRLADAGPTRAGISEAFGEQEHDPVRGVGSHNTKGINKQKKPDLVGDSNGRRIDASLTDSNDLGRRNRDFSSDEKGLYAKYEKEEPELKGPIKDDSQYKEYVKEYQEKYESYCSLRKILESYRDEFNKLGKDLEAYKCRDVKKYHDTLKQMRLSFQQCGERHKQQKKIFLVLYEELKHLKQMMKDHAASI